MNISENAKLKTYECPYFKSKYIMWKNTSDGMN